MNPDNSSRGWHERNPGRDADERIRDIYRDLYPSQAEDIATGGGYNEDSDGPTTVSAGFHPRRTLNDPSERAFLTDGGWGIVDAQSDYANAQRRGGITSRKPETGEFYVDGEEFEILLEQELGFTLVDFRKCFAPGRLPTELHPLRDRIRVKLARAFDEKGLSLGDGDELALRLFGMRRPNLYRIVQRGREIIAVRSEGRPALVVAQGGARTGADACGCAYARAAA